MREAFPLTQLPRYLLRDRHAIFAMTAEKGMIPGAGDWSIRRACLDHVMVFHAGELRRSLGSYFEYIKNASLLGKDSPSHDPFSRLNGDKS